MFKPIQPLLHDCCEKSRKCDIETVKKLLAQKDFDPNRTNSAGQTALYRWYVVAERGVSNYKYEILEVLLNKGAWDNNVFFDLVKEAGNWMFEKFLKFLPQENRQAILDEALLYVQGGTENAELLLDAGANPKNIPFNIPLILRSERLTLLFMQYNQGLMVDDKVRDKIISCITIEYCYCNIRNVIAMMRFFSIDINAKDSKNGRNIMHWLCFNTIASTTNFDAYFIYPVFKAGVNRQALDNSNNGPYYYLNNRTVNYDGFRHASRKFTQDIIDREKDYDAKTLDILRQRTTPFSNSPFRFLTGDVLRLTLFYVRELMVHRSTKSAMKTSEETIADYVSDASTIIAGHREKKALKQTRDTPVEAKLIEQKSQYR